MGLKHGVSFASDLGYITPVYLGVLQVSRILVSIAWPKVLGCLQRLHGYVKPLRLGDGLGVQEPVGFWDPLGFTADGNEATFKRRRSVELKHGRVSMAAAMGYITPEYYKFPGFLSPSLGLKFSDVPNGLAVLSKVPSLGLVQVAPQGITAGRSSHPTFSRQV